MEEKIMKSMVLSQSTYITKKLFSQKLPKYFLRDEIRKIIENVPGRNEKQRERNRLLLEIMWQTGARLNEALSLTPSDFDFNLKVVKIITLKKRKKKDGVVPVRIVPVKEQLLGLVAKYIVNNRIQDNEPLFKLTPRAVQKMVKEACRRAGIDGDDERTHPHTFRHSFAVHHVLNGTPVLVLNELLGHTNIESTLVYTRVLAQDARMYVDRVEY